MPRPALLQMMNEDDVFGLVHEADKQLYNTQTGDPAQDSINYGKARGTVLAALHQPHQGTPPGLSGEHTGVSAGFGVLPVRARKE